MQSKRGRFWIFALRDYDYRGGLNDFVFSFNKIEEFEDEIIKYTSGCSRFQLLDIETHYNFQSDIGTMTKWVCKNVGGETYEE